jgi:RNA 2',3'-cyclic 3'-phosphodiesterase
MFAGCGRKEFTLKFIGHVDTEKAEAIRSALKPIRSGQPVEITFSGLGFFPNDRRPRVVWCKTTASPNMTMLAAAVEEALQPLGIEPESRPFIPHVTLARIEVEKVPRTDIEKFVRAANAAESTTFGSACETEFHLYESLLKPSGAKYKRLQSFPFLKGTA